ncbi:MAG: flavodoxin domain-containing protein [Syntrophaceae bacterium]|nr:flavodoxin domain-containing protein [Syntrophaceae bacterium]
MSTIIIYTTRHGCTEKCALKIKDMLPDQTDMVNLKKTRSLDLSNYDMIIIGGSIHMGKVQKKVKNFTLRNSDILKNKKLGLFLCCMETGENADTQFNNAFPEDLRKHAAATGLFGGEFNLDKMNFIEKSMIKKIANIETSISRISEENIKVFVARLMKT